MSQLDLLAERIGLLEQANRRLRRTIALLVLGVATVLLPGAVRQAPDCVDTGRIIIHDKDGRVRAELCASDEGPRLTFLDRSGGERLRIHCPDDAASVISLGTGVEDHLRRRGIELRAAPDGWSSLSFADEQRERLTLGLAYDGEPRIKMFTRESRSRISLGSDMSGRADLVIHDASGDERAVVRVSPGGSPSVTLYDGRGDRLFSTPE